MIRPFPARQWTTPGAGDDADRCTVPPITRAAGSVAAIVPPGSTLSRCAPAAGPPNPSRNHHGTPFSVDSTEVAGPSSGPIDPATDAIDCALTATITTSWTPSSAAASGAAVASPFATRRDPSGSRTCSPSALIASRVAPRASTDAVTPSTPARPDAITPPIDPAPTTQIRMPHVLSSCREYAKVGS